MTATTQRTQKKELPKIFILEDDPDRIRYFKEKLGILSDLTIISSCTEADKFQPPYKIIFLDHDLGGRQLEDHEDCGLTFIQKIKDKLNHTDIVVIHSYNGSAAERMITELQGIASWPVTMYAPFRGKDFNFVMNQVVEHLETEYEQRKK